MLKLKSDEWVVETRVVGVVPRATSGLVLPMPTMRCDCSKGGNRIGGSGNFIGGGAVVGVVAGAEVCLTSVKEIAVKH